MYPDNWTLDPEDSEQSWPKTATVRSPSSSYWELQLYPDDTDVQELVETYREGMRQEYEDLESRDVRETVVERETVGCDMEFYCLDFVVAARVRCFRENDLVYLVLHQGEIRDLEEQAIVFRAITTSLLSS